MKSLTKLAKKTLLIVSSTWSLAMYMTAVVAFTCLFAPLLFVLSLLSTFDPRYAYKMTVRFLWDNGFNLAQIKQDFLFFIKKIYEAYTY